MFSHDGSLSIPFHSDFKDLSEEEETSTITSIREYTRENIIPERIPKRMSKSIPNLNGKDYNSEFKNNTLNDDVVHELPQKDTKQEITPEKELLVNQDSHLFIPLTILFSFIGYISFHLIPFLDIIPRILTSRLSPTLSQTTLILLSIGIGYTLSLNYSSIKSYFSQVKQSKSFPSLLNLSILITILYFINHPIRWSFDSLYYIHIHIPVIGAMVVLGILGILGVLVVVLMVVRSSWVVCDVTQTGFEVLNLNSDSGKRLRGSKSCGDIGKVRVQDGFRRNSMVSVGSRSSSKSSIRSRDLNTKESYGLKRDLGTTNKEFGYLRDLGNKESRFGIPRDLASTNKESQFGNIHRESYFVTNHRNKESYFVNNHREPFSVPRNLGTADKEPFNAPRNLGFGYNHREDFGFEHLISPQKRFGYVNNEYRRGRD